MSDTDTTIKVDPKLRNQMAKAMWMADNKGTEFADLKAKNAQFAEEREAYLKKASATIRILTRQGAQMTAAPTEAGAETSDA